MLSRIWFHIPVKAELVTSLLLHPVKEVVALVECQPMNLLLLLWPGVSVAAWRLSHLRALIIAVPLLGYV